MFDSCYFLVFIYPHTLSNPNYDIDRRNNVIFLLWSSSHLVLNFYTVKPDQLVNLFSEDLGRVIYNLKTDLCIYIEI